MTVVVRLRKDTQVVQFCPTLLIIVPEGKYLSKVAVIFLPGVYCVLSLNLSLDQVTLKLPCPLVSATGVVVARMTIDQ